MKIMGLSNTVHWSGWFTTSFIALMIGFTFVTIFLNFKIIAGDALLPYSNFFLLWIFFFFYVISVVTFCFLISVIFKKATTAGTLGTILFFVTHVVYYQFRDNFESLNYVVKLLYCLPLNTALGQGLLIMLDFEQENVGLNFSNFASHDELHSFSVAEVILTFVLSSAIHLLLMIYIEQVFTGDIGVAKPWYFPVSPIIRKFKKPSDYNTENNFRKQKTSIPENFENDPQNMKAGIKIQNMSKTFGKATVVNQLNLRMYEDQITVLLGHNGAGTDIYRNPGEDNAQD